MTQESMIIKPDMDEFYGIVINSEKTYEAIAHSLLQLKPVLIAWTDQEGTQLDILLNYMAIKYGPAQGGVRGTDLFVSVMRVGAFGFDAKEKDTHPRYYSEKLGLGSGVTVEKFAELINGIKSKL